jgi:protein-tyrosine phosphatase
MPRQVLFLCTGNYYRSRFAEELFNHLAAARELISSDSLAALRRLGIDLPEPIRAPRGICLDDLSRSERIIALKEAEHRPLLAARFPQWAQRTEYWHVDDLDCASADEALGQIETLVRGLIDRLPGSATT